MGGLVGEAQKNGMGLENNSLFEGEKKELA